MPNRRATAKNTGRASPSSPSTACKLWRTQSVPTQRPTALASSFSTARANAGASTFTPKLYRVRLYPLSTAKTTARRQSANRCRAVVVKAYEAATVEQSAPDKTTDILPSQFTEYTNPRRCKPKLTVETQTDKPAVAVKTDSALHAEHKEASVPALTPALTRGRINAWTAANAKHSTTKRRT